jgi:hypothetical protein
MPARRARGLIMSGAQIHPPDHAVAPPSTSSFSATMTFSPWKAAVTAADSPPAPDPTTRTSQVSSIDQAAVIKTRIHSSHSMKGFDFALGRPAGSPGLAIIANASSCAPSLRMGTNSSIFSSASRI